MTEVRKLKNGIRLIVNRIDGLLSVTCGILVKTGSINENDKNNGISHAIEHMMFKGTEKRSAFNISQEIDGIGAQINAFTAKELTCYYTKSTSDHLEDSMDVLSDIFFNSVFDDNEFAKEKGVIIEEINMSEDTPEDLCFDLLSSSYYGNSGLGRTILGTEKNIKSFSRNDIKEYLKDYYTSDNIVISIAGNINIDETVELASKYFGEYEIGNKSKEQVISTPVKPKNVLKSKKIEQTHVSFSMPAFKLADDRQLGVNIINTVLGGGMSSRLFQSIRENLGLCYNVYSCVSSYKDSGVIEIYAGVSNESRDRATEKILEEVKNFRLNGITKEEFIRGKEQLKSSFVLGQESTSSQMLLYGRFLLFLDKTFDFSERIKEIDNISFDEIQNLIKVLFDEKDFSSATVGPKRTPLKL